MPIHGFSRSLAVAIGIDAYGPGIPRLTTAVNDATRLCDLLQNHHGYETILLTQDKLSQPVTRECLAAAFTADLPARVGPDDRLLVYFAGHGVALDGDDGPAGYLLPQGAKPDDRSTFVPMIDLHAWLTALPCRHMLAFLDCCFAGAFRWSSTRDLRPLPGVLHKERYDRYVQSPAWQVITSASYDQRALDVLTGSITGAVGARGEGGRRHSPFAETLFHALEGAGDIVPAGGDGVITASELALYLRETVEVAAAERANAEQTPQLWPLNKHRKGEFVFLVPGHPLNLPPAPALTPEANPYRGLKSYDQRHSQLFFGREDEISEMQALVDAQPFVAVLGASGTGKSSLVKAGLLARLPEAYTVLPPVRPTDRPHRALEGLLRGQFDGEALPGAAGSPAKPAGEVVLGPDFSLAAPDGLAQVVGRWAAAHPGRRLVLTIDQFEELVTLCRDDAERAAFLALLAEAVRQHPDVFRLIIALRTDFEPQFGEAALFETAFARYVVPQMDIEDLRQAIEGPASVRVLYFDPPELVDDLIKEVIQTPGALPLLSFTLSELYVKYVQSARDDRGLTRADYEALGGVVGSLRNRATEEYERLPDDAHRRSMERVMLRMVAVEGGELARRRVALSELVYPSDEENARVQALLDRLVEARLLVRGTAENPDGSQGEPYVEPAHDALVLAWDRLLRWKQAAEEYLPLQRRLAQAATEWSAAPPNEKEGLLWNDDPRLPLLERVLAPRTRAGERGPLARMRRLLWPSVATPADTAWLNRLELVFTQASVQRRAAVLKRIVGITAAVIVVLTGLAIFAALKANEATVQGIEASRQRDEATTQRDRAVRQATLALSRQAAAQSGVHLDSNRRLAVLLAIQATQITTTVEARSSLLAAVVQKPLIEWSVTNGPDAVTSLAVSPDGRTLAATGVEGPIVLWTIQAQHPISTVLSLEVPDSHLAFTPDGAVLYAASRKGDLVGWNVSTGQVMTRTKTLHGAHVMRHLWIPAFSPDGEFLVAGDEGDSIALWTIASGARRVLAGLDPKPQAITAAAVSAGGELLVIGSEWGYGSLWNLETGQSLDLSGLYIDDEVDVTALTFSKSGKLLAAGGLDGSIHVMRVDAPSNEDFLSESEPARIDALAFSPDGDRLASADRQGGLTVWTIHDSVMSGTPLPGQVNPARSLAFTPDGRLLASGHTDGRITLWQLSGGPLGQEAFAMGEPWLSMALSPDGRVLAAISNHGITLSDVANQAKIAELPLAAAPKPVLAPAATADGSPADTASTTDGLSHTDYVEPPDWSPSLAFDPNGGRLAVADRSGWITVWDLKTMTVTAQLNSGGIVTDLAIGPARQEGNNELLAATYFGGGLTVWDLASYGRRDAALEQRTGCNNASTVQLLVFKPDRMSLASVVAGGRGWGSAALFDASGPEIAAKWLVAGCQPISKALARKFPDGRAIAFSADGRILAAGSFDGEIWIWRMEEGVAGNRTSLPAPSDVTAMAFGPDNRTLATATSAGQVVFWDANSLQEIGGPLTVDGGATELAFSPDGRKLIALTGKGTLLTWQMDLATWQSLACRIAGGNLTLAEWNTYFPDNPYQRTCPDLPADPSVVGAQK